VQRLCDAGLVERSHPRGADLQENHRHAVRDDVVQLMRDLGPLLVEDLALPCFVPGLREGELGAQRRGPVLPAAQPARRQPRQGHDRGVVHRAGPAAKLRLQQCEHGDGGQPDRQARQCLTSPRVVGGGRDEHDDHDEPRHQLQVVADDDEGRRVHGEYPREGEKRSGPPPHQCAGHQHAQDGVRQARPVIDRAVTDVDERHQQPEGRDGGRQDDITGDRHPLHLRHTQKLPPHGPHVIHRRK
jgi:hypothetical protein